MSCWWDYDFAVYGDLKRISDIEAKLPADTYETMSGDRVPVFHHVEIERYPGFLAIHASRNYGGGENPLHAIAELYPELSFAGIFRNEVHPGFICYYQCHKGELTGYEEVNEDWMNSPPVSQEYMEARLKNHIAKVKHLKDDITHTKEYLVRHFGESDLLIKEEIEKISQRINAEKAN
jgi:hypothetical protein